MSEETAADLIAEAKDLESKLEGFAQGEIKSEGDGNHTPEKPADSGAASEATKPAVDPAGQAPAEASAPAPEPAAPSAPEFKDSVGNVFDADGILIRREDGFEGMAGRR